MSRRNFGVLLLMLGVGLAGVATVLIPKVDAAAPRRINGITVSPAFQNITLTPENGSETFDFSVTNNTSEPTEFASSVIDFGSLDESGGVLFIGDAQKKLNYRYGLTSWASLERNRITVEPKSTAKVPVTIINKESLTPGGHYGAVLLSPLENGQRPTKVQVNQVLSSLLFVKKQGGEVYNFGLKNFEFNKYVFKMPDEVAFRFQNAGNVHVIPRGTVEITDPGGNLVKRGIINSDSAIILPETFRQVKAELTSFGRAWRPGTYTATIAYRFDGEAKTQVRQITFFYISPWYVISAVLFAAFAALLVFNKKVRLLVFSFVKRVFRRRRKAAKKTVKK